MNNTDKTLEDFMELIEKDCSGEWEPLDWQEYHSPTIEVEVLSPELEKIRCRRRVCDARLWNVLDEEQQRAAEEIYNGYFQVTGALGFKSRSYIKYDCDYNDSYEFENGVHYSISFRKWADEMRKNKGNVDLVINILCEGYSCAENDRKLGVRNGTSGRNLKESLDLYCVLQGWKSKDQVQK